MIELYQDVLAVAKTYMGFAAEEYIERRCRVSTDLKTAADLKREHIERLAAGIEMTAGAYMGEEKVKKFKEEIIKLKDNQY